MRGILQVDRWGDRRSYALLRGRPLRDRGQDSVGVVMSPEPPANFNIERDIPQRRLAEDWGDGAAIAGITCLFIFAHSQYLEPNAYNAAKIPSLLLAALGSGVVFAWTRSLVPSVVAHAISNVPMTPFWQGVIVATFILGTVLTARRG